MNGLTQIPFCPHTPTRRQRLFLALNTFEALYGGQASGGKSDALLMAALQHVDKPGYSALLLRRTFADLSKAGALMDRAAEWLRPTAARWVDREHRWIFPIGATKHTASLSFGYMDTEQDRFQYQGAEYQYVGYDELTQFLESMYLYCASRLRGPAPTPLEEAFERAMQSRLASVPLRLRGATNPGGVGHAWVKKRFVDPGDPSRPFVRSSAEDNPHIDQIAYARSLSVLDRTTHDQLAKGLWVLDEANRVYHYDSVTDVDGLPQELAPGLWRRILAIDLGASTRDPTTAFVRLAWHPHLDVTFVEYARCEAGIIPSRLAEIIKEELAGDPTESMQVVIDEGALGHGYGNELRVRYDLPVVAAEKRDKAGARRLLNGALEKAQLVLVEAAPCAVLRSELESLVYDARGMDVAPGLADHASDAMLYGWRLSQAHRAEAAPKESAFHSPEWWAQYEREQREKDIEAIQQRQAADGFTRW